ncbi:hypothetical protein BS50DRAFT_82224 [Corynespora cassiicola Philippines]|uniref:Uncharacterized protein n=1 Tax=Corynespora cassiicola Philippines TaxID=1448308 RepID=A0A2T2MZG1_CORCC|nr:hypothetical protein BS50DRAFT_82224 [Corynespora cassiicola Philippines]
MPPVSLLELPRELRDLIYDYALFEPRGLLCATSACGARKLYKRGDTHPAFRVRIGRILRYIRHLPRRLRCNEHNQLKYVCWTLYEETVALSVRLNCIVFQDSSTMNAVQQSVDYAHRCSTLRRVAIMCSPSTFSAEYNQPSFSTLMEHCSARPELLARIHIPYWSQTDPNFILVGLSYLSLLRSDRALIALVARIASVSFLSDSTPTFLTTAVRIPRNFRFFPREESFDRLIFERAWRRNHLLSQPSTQAALGDFCRLAEGWFETGL